MSANAEIELPWGDDDHVFRLALGQLRDLQKVSGCGPFVLYERFVERTCMIDDLRETIRLGLIGGGMKADAALDLVKRHFDEWPLDSSLGVAKAVLGAALVGVPDDPVEGPKPGKPKAARARKRAASPSPRSTAQAA